MKTKFIEACNSRGGKKINWGKFAVCQFDAEELQRRATQDELGCSLVLSQGWDATFLWVLDLATGEGACFRPGGSPHADLDKHRIWVCPMFEPFLTWLYQQDLSDLDALPNYVEFDESKAPGALYGHRRPGPAGTSVA